MERERYEKYIYLMEIRVEADVEKAAGYAA